MASNPASILGHCAELPDPRRDFEGCERSLGESPSRSAKVTTAATKEIPTDPVAR